MLVDIGISFLLFAVCKQVIVEITSVNVLDKSNDLTEGLSLLLYAELFQWPVHPRHNMGPK